MKKLFLALMVLCSICSCSDKKSEDSSKISNAVGMRVDENKIEEEVVAEVRARIEEIYANNELQDPEQSWSKALNAVYESAKKACEEDGMDPIDYDPWLMAQDSDKPKMHIENVTVIDPTHADAEISVSDFGQTQEQTLRMVKEGKVWKVDDFVTTFDGAPNSLKTSLDEY